MSETEYPLMEEMRRASDELSALRYGLVPNRYAHVLATLGLADELGAQLARLDVSWSDLVAAEKSVRDTVERVTGRPGVVEVRDVLGVALQKALDATSPTS